MLNFGDELKLDTKDRTAWVINDQNQETDSYAIIGQYDSTSFSVIWLRTYAVETADTRGIIYRLSKPKDKPEGWRVRQIYKEVDLTNVD